MYALRAIARPATAALRAPRMAPRFAAMRFLSSESSPSQPDYLGVPVRIPIHTRTWCVGSCPMMASIPHAPSSRLNTDSHSPPHS